VNASTIPSPMGSAALQYARAGWPVFPCRESDGAPYTNAKGEEKIPRCKSPYVGNGVKDATTDEAVIVEWWRRWPNAQIGVAMGRNGLFALDFDPRVDQETGEVWTLDRLKTNLEAMIGCPVPVSLVAVTPSGGVHVYLKQPRDDAGDIRNRGVLPDHVDVRGRGGYVIAPPSTSLGGENASAGRYRWLAGRQDVAPAEAPASLLEILRTPSKAAVVELLRGRGGDDALFDQLWTKWPKGAAAATAPGERSPRPTIAPDANEAVRAYALKALDREIAELRGSVQGTRNNNLNASSYALGQLVGAGALDEMLARTMLEAVAREWPDFSKSQGTIDNGLSAGIAVPRDLSEVRENAERRAENAQRYGPRPFGPASAVALPREGADGQQPSRDGSMGDDAGGTGERGGGRKGRVSAAMAMHRRLARFPMTDLGNAERFWERFGRDFKWSPALGWLGWDGKRWKILAAEDRGTPGQVLTAIYRTVRLIRREAWIVRASGTFDPETNPDGLDRQVYDDKDKPKKLSTMLFKWAEKSEASGKISCIPHLVQPWAYVEPDALDADPFVVNVWNATLRFRREKGADGKWKVGMRVDPHRREDLITKISPVLFDRSAECPIYDRIFAWAQPKAEMREYLHRWAGYNLTGDMGEQALHFWHGGGGNGKSTIIDAWAWCAGDYEMSVGIETFLDQGIKKNGANATPDLARLGGVRMARTSEPEKGAQLAEGLIKLVTGGEPMPVRFLNKGFFDLRPTYKLTISGNHWLGIAGTDYGIWRRVKLVPWESRIADADKDDTLPEQLRREASGILNRMITGLIDWMRNGLAQPETVTRATQEYREESDPLGRFLNACTEQRDGATTQSSALHAVYAAWCKVAGEKEWTGKGFTSAMLDRGYRKHKSSSVQWLGLALTRQVEDFVDENGKPRIVEIEPEARPRDPPSSAAWPDDDVL